MIASTEELARRLEDFRAYLRLLARLQLDPLRHYYFHGLKYRPMATGDSDFLRRLNELESPDSSLSRLWDREYDEHVVASLMQRLQGDFAPVTWQAFLRHVQEGESAVQVAEALGQSLNSVLLAKSRVLKPLRQEAAGLVD